MKSIDDSENALNAKMQKFVPLDNDSSGSVNTSGSGTNEAYSIASPGTSSSIQSTPGTGQQKRPMITPPELTPSGSSFGLQDC